MNTPVHVAGLGLVIFGVHFAHIRQKLERDPSRPRHFITEPRIGYRLEIETAD